MCGQISARLGQAEEERVLQHFVEAGHACLGRNIRLSGVEIDLLIRTQDSEIWILEVKKISNLQYYERRVTPKQRQRILRVLRFFLESGKKARAHLVLVDSESIRTEMDFFIHDL